MKSKSYENVSKEKITDIISNLKGLLEYCQNELELENKPRDIMDLKEKIQNHCVQNDYLKKEELEGSDFGFLIINKLVEEGYLLVKIVSSRRLFQLNENWPNLIKEDIAVPTQINPNHQKSTNQPKAKRRKVSSEDSESDWYKQLFNFLIEKNMSETVPLSSSDMQSVIRSFYKNNCIGKGLSAKTYQELKKKLLKNEYIIQRDEGKKTNNYLTQKAIDLVSSTHQDFRDVQDIQVEKKQKITESIEIEKKDQSLNNTKNPDQLTKKTVKLKKITTNTESTVISFFREQQPRSKTEGLSKINALCEVAVTERNWSEPGKASSPEKKVSKNDSLTSANKTAAASPSRQLNTRDRGTEKKRKRERAEDEAATSSNEANKKLKSKPRGRSHTQSSAGSSSAFFRSPLSRSQTKLDFTDICKFLNDKGDIAVTSVQASIIDSYIKEYLKEKRINSDPSPSTCESIRKYLIQNRFLQETQNEETKNRPGEFYTLGIKL